MNGESAYWKKQQVADHLSISVRAVERLLAAGEFVKLKVGAATRVSVKSVHEFVMRNTGKGGV
jgi:hypothetical protein